MSIIPADVSVCEVMSEYSDLGYVFCAEETR